MEWGSAHGIGPVTCRPAFYDPFSESDDIATTGRKCSENHAIKRSEKLNFFGGRSLNAVTA